MTSFLSLAKARFVVVAVQAQVPAANADTLSAPISPKVG